MNSEGPPRGAGPRSIFWLALSHGRIVSARETRQKLVIGPWREQNPPSVQALSILVLVVELRPMRGKPRLAKSR